MGERGPTSYENAREMFVAAFTGGDAGRREEALVAFERWWSTAETGNGALVFGLGEHRLILVACDGCGVLMPEGQRATIWIDTPLGLTTGKTHRDQGCARAAVARHREQPAKRVRAPVTRAERAGL